MVTILDRYIALRLDPSRPIQILLAQTPCKLAYRDYKILLSDPKDAERTVLPILEMVSRAEEGLEEVDFVLIPEASLPMGLLERALEVIEKSFRPNTVTCFGLEHICLRDYVGLLETFKEDNPEAHRIVSEHAKRDEARKPVNSAIVAVKDDQGRLRCFIEAKTHPFAGEEYFEDSRDLYRGRHVYLFRSELIPFNFMTLICLDYIYRDITTSNIQNIIDRANELYFVARQQLDLLIVIQCNPKPEHPAFWEVVNGFYGEYLTYTPGVRQTVTCFCNASEESQIPALKEPSRFGASSIVMSRHHKVKKLKLGEFSIDTFNDAPVNRLRFGTATRLFHVSIAPSHEPDPRTTRAPMKVLGIFKHSKKEGWHRVSMEEVMLGLQEA